MPEAYTAPLPEDVPVIDGPPPDGAEVLCEVCKGGIEQLTAWNHDGVHTQSPSGEVAVTLRGQHATRWRSVLPRGMPCRSWARTRRGAAQRATGQGAVQVSGQQQVANVPLREALEAAGLSE